MRRRRSPLAAGNSVAARHAGRLGAKLFLAAGALTIANNHIPPYEHLNRPVLYAIGAGAVACGVVAWFTPWHRWPRSFTILLAPVALALIALANMFGGVSTYSYGVYFVVVFVYVGMTQPPRTALSLAPIALAAYVAPSFLSDAVPVSAAFYASTAIPVSVLVGEVVARAAAKQREAQDVASRRAELLATLATTGRAVNTLDTAQVLETVVDGARALGFHAAEICVFDEAAGVHRSVCSRNLPDGYVGSASVHPIGSGIAGAVRRTRRTVVVDDYSASDLAVPQLRDEGYLATVAVPIFRDRDLAATLTAGVRGPAEITSEDTEVLELLAGFAGRALENARRFEDERRALARLADVERLKSDFISNVSHELRTPLTVITGMGQTLAGSWERLTREVRDDLLERLNRNALALDEIVSTLLDFSRLEAGELELHRQPVDLRVLCDSVAGRIRSLLSRHALTVRVAADAVVDADPVYLERVLENLLSNAAKHTPPGTHVELSLRVRSGTATLGVADDGPGISEGDLAELGHRFFRGGAADTRATRGAGLGLAFSREILRLHGTGLEIVSRVGEGSSFSFSLPIVGDGGPDLEISAAPVAVASDA